MTKIELGPLTQFLDDSEIKDLMKALKKLGVGDLPASDEAGGRVGDDLDEDVFADFLDRLDAEDAAADLYIPAEFDGVVEIAGIRVASSNALLDVLDEIKDDLAVSGDEAEEEEDDDYEADEDEDAESEEEEEEEDDDLVLKERQLRLCWKSLHAGATASVERELPLFVKG
jgi:hypothetical protein